MRKIFYLLALLTIFNASSKAQFTCIPLNIYNPSEQDFLDTVEAKLLFTIGRIQKGEKDISLNEYSVTPWDGSDWGVRLSAQELKDTTPLPKNIPTYKYELVIKWDSVLNNGFLLGFSKEYYYDSFVQPYGSPKAISGGVHCAPFYHIPLAQYNTFLNKEEVARLDKILEKTFLEYINDDSITRYQWFRPIKIATYPLSYQTLDFSKWDSSFVLMPLSFWAKLYKDKILGGEILCYKDAWCNTPLTRTEILNIFRCTDSIVDENGFHKAINDDASLISITVAEKWGFDNEVPYNFFYPYALKISKEIKSIAINTYCQHYDRVPETKRLWLRYNDIKSINKTQINYHYEDELQVALFKKLSLEYH